MSAKEKVKSRPEKEKSKLKMVLLGNSERGFLLDLLLSTSQQKRSNSLQFLETSLENETIEPKSFEFETENKKFTLIDAIGHRLFLKNLITRRTEADCALLVVSCADLEQDGSKEQMAFVKNFGWKLVVACNEVELKEEEKIEIMLKRFRNELKEIGFDDQSEQQVVPISCIFDQNISSPSFASHPSLFQALDSLNPLDLSQKPLRLPIKDVFKIGGIGTVSMGRIESGILREGIRVVFSPLLQERTVGQLQCTRYVGEVGETGMNLGFCVPGMETREIDRGFVCSDAKKPAIPVKQITAMVYVLPQEVAIRPGRVLELSCHTVKMNCTVQSLENKLSRRTGKPIDISPRELKGEEFGTVDLVPELTRSFERFCDFPALGHLFLKENGKLVAVGAIQQLVEEKFPRIWPENRL